MELRSVSDSNNMAECETNPTGGRIADMVETCTHFELIMARCSLTSE